MKTSKFTKRLKTMLEVDTRRMFTTPLFYIFLAIAAITPILILVMTTMMDGSVSVNPETGEETVIEAFDSTWLIIGNVSANMGVMDMSLTGMCNINMMYFAVAVLVCIFTSGDFTSGYAKNLFTVRAGKIDYVASKTLVCTAASVAVILAFFLGSMLGGAVSGLPFDLLGADAIGALWCVLTKMALVMLFVPLALLMSVIAKSKLWLSILLTLGSGMLLFTMIPMISPLDSTFVNFAIALVGGTALSVGVGAISNIVLNKTALI